MLRIPHLSLNKPADWEAGTAINIQISDAGVHLQKELKYNVDGHFFIPLHIPIADLASDGEGKLYLLDAKGSLLLLDPATQSLEPLFPVGHQMFNVNAQLLGQSDRWIIAQKNGTSLTTSAYSIRNGQQIWSMESRKDKEGKPGEVLAFTHDEQHNLFQFVRYVEEDYSNENAISEIPPVYVQRYEIHCYNQRGILQQVLCLPILWQHQIEEINPSSTYNWQIAAANGFVYITEPQTRTIWKLDQQDKLEGVSIVSFGMTGHILADVDGTLYIGAYYWNTPESEKHPFILAILTNGFVERVAGYNDRLDKMFYGQHSQILIYNQQDASVTILEKKRNTRTAPEYGGLPRGTLILPSADSGNEATVWHNMVLEAQIPAETRVIVRYTASDHKRFLWQNKSYDFDEWLQSEHIPTFQKLKYIQEQGTVLPPNPHNAFLTSAKGRYLWIAIELVGSGSQSPLITELQLFYPRSSLLSYLPSIYQEGPPDSFLERFISLFGHFLRQHHEQIAGVSAVFDSEQVDGAFLKWLASWLNIVADDSWSDERLRAYIQIAPKLYQIRGTRQAMQQMVKLLTGYTPHILEHFQYKHLLHDPDWEKALSLLYTDMPYHFLVILPPHSIASEQQKEMVQRMIARDQPAMTEAELIVLEPRIRLGGHTYLEVNSILASPSRLAIDNQSVVSYDTILTEGEEKDAAVFPFRLNNVIQLNH